MKILLVDDEQKFASMLSKRLELRGFHVKPCFSGEQALDAMRMGERFDVAILDIKMPGIGGVELRRELSQLDPDIRFVFLTGHGSNDECIVDGEMEPICLPKPLKIETLILTLHQIVKVSADSEKDDKCMDRRDG